MSLAGWSRTRSSEAWAPGPATDPTSAPSHSERGHRHRQRHARQLAHADPVQRPQQQHGDHGQHRDLVRERTDRRDVVQRGHDRDGDGQQVGADHQRARDDADARAERLGRGRHPAPALRVAVGDLQVLRARRTRRRSSPPARTTAPARRPGRRGSPGRSRPTSPGRRTRPPRPARGPGSRRRGRRVGPVRFRVAGRLPWASSAIYGGAASTLRRVAQLDANYGSTRNNRSDFSPAGILSCQHDRNTLFT